MNSQFLSAIKKIVFTLCVCFVLAAFVHIPPPAFSAENDAAKTLIIYYSRSGKTKLISETLAQKVKADILEIKDQKDRSGWWGFMLAGLDAFRHVHTPIEPEKPNIAPYATIIIATPIWSWNVSSSIHTLFEKNRFDGKKLILLTTANIHIMKYEQYGDDAPFIKRYLKGYLRDKRKAAVDEVVNSGGIFIGHYHFETQNKSDEQLIEETAQCDEYVNEKISAAKQSSPVSQHVSFLNSDSFIP